jgi:hypothetical protein
MPEEARSRTRRLVMPRPCARAQLLRSWAETMPLTAKVAATAIDWSAGDHRLRPSSANKHAREQRRDEREGRVAGREHS